MKCPKSCTPLIWDSMLHTLKLRDKFSTLSFLERCLVTAGMGGGGQPDSDMKVDFGEIGIGKIGNIGISDFISPKFVFFADFGEIGNKKFFEFLISNPKNRFLANFGEIGNEQFLEYSIFDSKSATVIGIFVPILAKKVFQYILNGRGVTLDLQSTKCLSKHFKQK